MKMKLVSLNYSTKQLSAVMNEANYMKIWLFSEKNVDDVLIPIIDIDKESSTYSYDESLVAKPKIKARKCLSLENDSQSSEYNIENCLNKNYFMCYKKKVENNFYKSSTIRRALNTILIVTSLFLLQFV